MRILDPGHDYSCQHIDGAGSERIQFVKRMGKNYPGNRGLHSGTTSQEVLRALIDRAKYVDNQIPCWQTKLSIWLMRGVIWLYERRAAARHHRAFPLKWLRRIEHRATCPDCGHIDCYDFNHHMRGPFTRSAKPW